MKTLDWYIIKKFVGTFFYAILIMAVISCVIDYTEKMGDFDGRDVPWSERLEYFKNFIPHIVALLFPLFIFIATIFFTSKIAYKSEIIAMLASGISYQRFLRPYIIGALFLCTISFFANHWLVPAANKDRIAFENKYLHYNPSQSDRNIHLRLSKDLFVYMQSYDYVANMGYRFTAETIKGTELKEKLMADRASYDTLKGEWTLFNAVVRKNNGIAEKLQTHAELKKKYPFTPFDLEEDETIKEALTTPQLDQYIAREKLRGRETLNFFYVEKYRRTSQPVAGIILTIIGACIASRKIRGGSGLHLAMGIVISALYIMALQLTNTFSTKAGLEPILAVWIPNMVFGLLALYLFIRQVR
jgi:lipopolysaccharide export system permease protein